MAIKIWRLLFLSICLTACSSSNGGGQTSNSESQSGGEEEMRVMHDEPIYKEIDAIPFAKSLWQEPQYFFDEELDNQGCKALFIRSDYNNQESYAFAYLGLPEGELKDKPAVLLIHGGGGTAYYEWVNAWKERGYIALAIDLEGHIPNKTGTIGDAPGDLYHASTYTAPHNQNLGDENEDITLTWLHYACRTSIIANSFLHHYAGVNPYKIGVCGVSWGGYITSIISGYDDRFAFAIPYYCITDMVDGPCPIGTYQTPDTFTDAGKPWCTPCAAGTYQNQAGKTTCIACPNGTTSNPGATSANQCGINYTITFNIVDMNNEQLFDTTLSPEDYQ